MVWLPPFRKWGRWYAERQSDLILSNFKLFTCTLFRVQYLCLVFTCICTISHIWLKCSVDSHLIHCPTLLFLWRFLLQLVGILLEDIVTKQPKVEMSEQQHTFYCQELGTLLMCLIHIFKSGRWIPEVLVSDSMPSCTLYLGCRTMLPSGRLAKMLCWW